MFSRLINLFSKASTQEPTRPWKTGDLFLVPQSDGGHTIAQVLSYEIQAMNSAVCAFTLRRVAKGDPIKPVRLNEVISIQFVTIDLLDSKIWPIVGHAPIPKFQQLFNLQAHRKNQFIGTTTIGSGIITDFLNACFGLEPWDDWYDPKYLDKLLLSPEKAALGHL